MHDSSSSLLSLYPDVFCDTSMRESYQGWWPLSTVTRSTGPLLGIFREACADYLKAGFI